MYYPLSIDHGSWIQQGLLPEDSQRKSYKNWGIEGLVEMQKVFAKEQLMINSVAEQNKSGNQHE